MSENSHSGGGHSFPPRDLRARRSRDVLGDALIELILERPFESITVQHVIDRAGVARSTFYSHFHDKQDLFVSDVDEFLAAFATRLDRLGEGVDGPVPRVAAVRELFEHVASARDLWVALRDSGQLDVVLELGRAHFAIAIEARLIRASALRGSEIADASLVARAFASLLITLLDEWMRRGCPGGPNEQDELFHRLLWRGVGR